LEGFLSLTNELQGVNNGTRTKEDLFNTLENLKAVVDPKILEDPRIRFGVTNQILTSESLEDFNRIPEIQLKNHPEFRLGYDTFEEKLPIKINPGLVILLVSEEYGEVLASQGFWLSWVHKLLLSLTIISGILILFFVIKKIRQKSLQAYGLD
jgi:hypothetical protein